MRKRKEIVGSSERVQDLTLEVLLDIRDLLAKSQQKKNRKKECV